MHRCVERLGSLRADGADGLRPGGGATAFLEPGASQQAAAGAECRYRGTTRGTMRGTILHHPAPSSPPNHQPTKPQDLYRNAVLKDETRLSRLFELQDAVASARQELSAYDGASCEGCGVDGTAFAVLSQMTEKCETLHLELHGQRGNREKDIGGWGLGRSGEMEDVHQFSGCSF